MRIPTINVHAGVVHLAEEWATKVDDNAAWLDVAPVNDEEAP